MPEDASEAISDRLALRAEELAGDAYESLLDGAAAAWALRAGVAAPCDGPSELQEIERLMGSFAGELSKMDEVLEVLAAHVRRMRTHSERGVQGQRAPAVEPTVDDPDVPRILH